ncbi:MULTISPECIES: ArsR/SmtB family transcription factor [unclassified Rhizobium]|uniref:ArsR/SmtB family transcription factor n=1 Tax=unclassified Rhizobium TaxID=2613769 RepID=UPI0037F54DC8
MSSEPNGDLVFKALAHPFRRGLLDQIKDEPKTTGNLCEAHPGVDRCTVMQHLKILEEAGLVIAKREGRERWNHLNALPIKAISDRWISQYANHALNVLEMLSNDLA